MWRNYLTVGVRALMKNRTYAFINIFGLAVGLAACLMLLLYVRYETSYDAWLPNSENAYQFQSHYRDPQTGEETLLQMTSYIAGARAKADFPQIERSVYAWSSGPIVLRGSEALEPENVLLTDGLFFDVLRFPFVKGDPATALSQANTIVLTESEARRIFGAEDPMGKTVTMVQRGISLDYRVTGVVRDVPRNSHVRFNMVARIDPGRIYAESPQMLTSWGWQSGWFYFTVRPGADIAAMQAQLPAWERRNIPDQTFGQVTSNQGDNQDWKIVNVRDVHLGEANVGTMAPLNDRRTIVTFTVIAFLILGMACVNFTNLATARASQRAREVALRKVLGANRQQLVLQFLIESVLIAAIAMLAALALVELLLPALSSFLDAELGMTYFGAGSMLLPIVLLTLLVGAAGGIYPAFYLSRFQPAQVLKANKSTAEAAGSGRLRNALVIAQFAVSIGLIICTAVVYAQTVYARTTDPGYRRDGLIQIENLGRRQLVERADAIVEELKRVPGVVSVGRSSIGISTTSSISNGVQVPGQADPVNIDTYNVDANFFETMGIRLIAGRLFDENRPADDFNQPFSPTPESQRALVARGANVVINELAARRLGFRNPADAVGKTVQVSYVEAEYGVVPTRIIGVVQDSRFRSIRQPLDAIMFGMNPPGAGVLLVRYDASDPRGVRDRVAQAWRRLSPDVPFDGVFSEERVAEVYEAEAARTQVFAGFAMLAVIIACLGLFGLAAFTAERRTKEIGIRKVLGARTRDIVGLLAWQFSKPVIIANLIAWPAAWWAMREWLNTFDARIDLGPTPFVLAGLIALAIAIGTIAGHAFKVARANPIHALRYE
ncbi:ABC transporter permease [Sphingosinicella sp. LHD-64]|uniref:ABC transporter permease n=1 Tax=Sphingosinicella sp. LHD-64 TaxID=3072139 RepID=UPI00280CCF06|nr:ABC transporter permease [Sphingosinicella sp. LHD-64]MDQ8756101.1 ABC transporter permease [Sphingosinicella sp. LHD-64]